LNGPKFRGYVSDKLGLNTIEGYSIPCKCGQVYTAQTNYLLRVGCRSTTGISPLDKWRSQPWKSITLTVRTPKSSSPNPDTWTIISKRWSKPSLIPTKCSAGHGNFSFTLWWNRERLLVKIHINNHYSPFHSPSKTSLTAYDPLYLYFQASIPHIWHPFIPQRQQTAPKCR